MQTEKVIKYIVDWLIDYHENAGTNGFVVGVSGGIDSAVTSTLCAKTGINTLVLEMPIHQAIDQVSRAKNHINWLESNHKNLQSKNVNLTSVFDTFSTSVKSNLKVENTALSLANSRARLRMTTLYYYAGLNRMLVVGTGNKVEDFGVGFFTKYGDGGVDLSPIADLLKSEVYKIANTLGINQEIQNAKPTDGLWADNRTDEEQMGATYAELEWAMMVNENGIPENISIREKEVLKIYNRLNKLMQHKINPIPICNIPLNLKN